MQTENNRKMCKHIKDKEKMTLFPPLPLPRKGAKRVPKENNLEALGALGGGDGNKKASPQHTLAYARNSLIAERCKIYRSK